MGLYYNKTRGPINIELAPGISGVISPKQWLEIESEYEGASSLIRLVKKGVLVRRDSVISSPPSPPPFLSSSPLPSLIPSSLDFGSDKVVELSFEKDEDKSFVEDVHKDEDWDTSVSHSDSGGPEIDSTAKKRNRRGR
jgi:hypothetical protein